MICKEMLSLINVEGNSWLYVLITSVCANKNNYLPIEDRYRGLIFQHALAKILNASQRSIKWLHQPNKPHGHVGKFPNRQKLNKEAYDTIDVLPHKIKEGIDEPIVTRYDI